MTHYLVSIILPCYNSEKYLRETLHSVISQTYSNWECIIVDDGSVDSSKEIALEFCERDTRFQYFSQINSGPSAARNRGIKLSKGDYIQFLDSDDVILPDRLHLMIEKYKGTKEGIILYSDFHLGEYSNIYIRGKINKPTNIGHDISFNDMYKYFSNDFIIIPSCLLFPRKTIFYLKWDETLKNSEDWDYYLRILDQNYLLRFVDIPLVIYRNTPNSLSKDVEKTIKANYAILLRWVHPGLYISYINRNALLFNKSIINYLSGKSKIIIPPYILCKNKKLIVFILCLLIFPLTFYLLIFNTLKQITKFIINDL
jgi:glycosyltransferase involved in cell wall biosynthesis